MGNNNIDYPMGGFVADIVCPFCGKEMKGNIPATPTDNEYLTAEMFCPNNSYHSFFIRRYRDGSWKIITKR